MLVNIESVSDFAERNGGNGIRHNNRILYPSGACYIDDVFGRRVEASNDPYTKLKAQELYYTNLLERTTSDFHSLQAALTRTGHKHTWKDKLYGSPTGHGPSDLRTLQRLVFEQREKLEAVRQELEQTPQVQARRVREQSLAEARRAGTEALQILASDARQIQI